MPVAQIDTQELFDFINDHGVKDLDNFRVRSKLLKLSRKYEQLIPREPVIAYTYMAIIEAYKNNYDLSVDLLKRALKLSPLEPVVLQNLGKSYEQNGDYENAIATYFEALKINTADEDVFKNTFLLAEFYCDVETLGELENVNSNLYQKMHLSNVFHLFNFLKDKNFDFENYRIQLACAYKVVNRYMNINRSAIERLYNFEGNYLSNILEIDHVSVELLSTITLEFEEEIYKIASSQPDGGFDFYEKLSQSSFVFNFLNPERQIA